MWSSEVWRPDRSGVVNGIGATVSSAWIVVGDDAGTNAKASF